MTGDVAMNYGGTVTRASDTFKFTTEDVNTSGPAYTDTIKDFDISNLPGDGGDIIDVSTMLYGCNASNYANYIQATTVGSNTQLTFDVDGTGGYTGRQYA